MTRERGFERDGDAAGSGGAPDLGRAYPELAAEGWQYRWCGEGDRMEEQRALYEELGFETKIVPLALCETDGSCQSCYGNERDRYRVLFTRPASGSRGGEARAPGNTERPAGLETRESWRCRVDAEREDLIIRTVKPEDCARLVKMDEDHNGRRRTAWYEGKVKRALEDSDVHISLGAEMDGILVGALLGSLDYGEFGKPEPVAILDTLLVDRELGRRGIATALMDQLLKNLRGLCISRLRTEVDWTDRGLTSFFGKVGFSPIPRLVLELDVESTRLEPEGPDGESRHDDPEVPLP